MLAGNVAMEAVRNRMAGLHKALEAESWERRKAGKSQARRVELGIASRRGDRKLLMNQWSDVEGVRSQMMAAQAGAATGLNTARQAATREVMQLTANRAVVLPAGLRAAN